VDLQLDEALLPRAVNVRPQTPTRLEAVGHECRASRAAAEIGQYIDVGAEATRLRLREDALEVWASRSVPFFPRVSSPAAHWVEKTGYHPRSVALVPVGVVSSMLSLRGTRFLDLRGKPGTATGRLA